MEETTLAERIEALHSMGLDCRYDDVLGVEDMAAESEDLHELLKAGPAYDYVGQRWMASNDHAHFASADGGLPLLFCGADITSCVGLERQAVAS